MFCFPSCHSRYRRPHVIHFLESNYPSISLENARLGGVTKQAQAVNKKRNHKSPERPWPRLTGKPFPTSSGHFSQDFFVLDSCKSAEGKMDMFSSQTFLPPQKEKALRCSCQQPRFPTPHKLHFFFFLPVNVTILPFTCQSHEIRESSQLTCWTNAASQD